MHKPIQHLYKVHNDEGLLYAWFSSMHTRVDIILYCKRSEEELMAAINQIYTLLHQLESVANYYDPNSELAYVNQTADKAPVSISRTLYEMIALCLQYNKKTLGCFDATIHSKNYHQGTIRHVCLSPDDQSIFFRQEGITLNLSGLLKGYALDSIRELLTKYKIENALINMGNSSILAMGNHPVGKGWKVSFALKANANDNYPSPEIILYDECLTTSGNDSPDRKHIICPHSGQLIEGQRQIAVVTANGTVGEILSTSLFVANEEQRKAMLPAFHPLKIIDL